MQSRQLWSTLWFGCFIWPGGDVIQVATPTSPPLFEIELVSCWKERWRRMISSASSQVASVGAATTHWIDQKFGCSSIALLKHSPCYNLCRKPLHYSDQVWEVETTALAPSFWNTKLRWCKCSSIEGLYIYIYTSISTENTNTKSIKNAFNTSLINRKVCRYWYYDKGKMGSIITLCNALNFFFGQNVDILMLKSEKR